MDFFLEKCDAFIDKRGDLVQFITQDFLNVHNLPFGQIYFISFGNQGDVRGNHYHLNSKEIFCLIKGEVEIKIQNVETNEKKVIILSDVSQGYQKLYIGNKIAHAITCISESALMICYSSAVYSELNQDKHPFCLT
jgi:dTDP-4-dehydrorhamnose 3,5-epimerase-like enzyme